MEPLQHFKTTEVVTERDRLFYSDRIRHLINFDRKAFLFYFLIFSVLFLLPLYFVLQSTIHFLWLLPAAVVAYFPFLGSLLLGRSCIELPSKLRKARNSQDETVLRGQLSEVTTNGYAEENLADCKFKLGDQRFSLEKMCPRNLNDGDWVQLDIMNGSDLPFRMQRLTDAQVLEIGGVIPAKPEKPLEGNFPDDEDIPLPSRELETASSTETMSNVFPLLKQSKWGGEKLGILSVPFGPSDGDSGLIVNFCFDREGEYRFLTNTEMDGLSLEEIHQIALQNLEKIPFELDPVQLPNGIVLTASGSSFSSEKVLSPAFLQAVNQRLETSMIMVSIPRRTCLYAVSATAPKDVIAAFLEFHKHTLADDSYGNAVISDRIYVFDQRNEVIRMYRPN
ncbi:MAG: hypothetical protein RLZZ519_3422 [Bacteroidota bacterium]